jgi:hypothetical protein
VALIGTVHTDASSPEVEPASGEGWADEPASDEWADEPASSVAEGAAFDVQESSIDAASRYDKNLQVLPMMAPLDPWEGGIP